MSFFMLRGKPGPFKVANEIIQQEITINRFYELYKLKQYAFVPTFVDGEFTYKFRRSKRYKGNPTYVEINFSK